jgi:hypothetical protein
MQSTHTAARFHKTPIGVVLGSFRKNKMAEMMPRLGCDDEMIEAQHLAGNLNNNSGEAEAEDQKGPATVDVVVEDGSSTENGVVIDPPRLTPEDSSTQNGVVIDPPR